MLNDHVNLIVPHISHKKVACFVCTEEKEVGMFIWGHFLCRECEGEMIQTEVHDAKYPFFIKQMSKIWA